MPAYRLEVRAAEEPHEVLGELPVPYAAAIGEQPVVRFESRRRSDDRTITVITLEVHRFAHGRTGARWFAFKVKRDEWPALKASIA